MSAQPVHDHDPRDPQAILDALPDRVRPKFLEEYHAAVDGAHEVVGGYSRLQELLHLWRLRSIAYAKPDYQQRIDEIQAGTAPTVPIENVIADRFDISPEDAAAYWDSKVAEARARRAS